MLDLNKSNILIKIQNKNEEIGLNWSHHEAPLVLKMIFLKKKSFRPLAPMRPKGANGGWNIQGRNGLVGGATSVVGRS
jgi:hypothetical protein